MAESPALSGIASRPPYVSGVIAPKTILVAFVAAAVIVIAFPLLVASPLPANVKFLLYIGLLAGAFTVTWRFASRSFER